MKKTIFFFSMAIITLVSNTAAASAARTLLGEVRLSYGNTNGAPSEYNNAYFKFQDGPEIYQQTYTGIDAIVMLPLIPLGFGLRYESASKSETKYNEKVDYTINRTAVLVNYRIIDKKFYVGPIVSYGLAQNLSFKLPLDPDEFKAGSSSSYSYGIEGGIKFGFVRVGAEAGVSSLVFSDLKDKDRLVPKKNGLDITQLNFGGTYYRLHLGVGF